SAPARIFKPRKPASANGDPTHIWALKDVSFEVRQGEVVGVIGPNGAGKTTLLKILARVTKPTTGHAEVRGRMGSLLEVGTGFHAELTGRENTYLNGAILGMKKKEIDRKFDEIVAFAEVERFIDTPVRSCSWMKFWRLGTPSFRESAWARSAKRLKAAGLCSSSATIWRRSRPYAAG